MHHVQTVIRRDPWEVEPRLKELGLTSSGLRRVRDVALGARNNATAFHPANAAGTFAYQVGVWCLRDEFVTTKGWKTERPGGVEAIVSQNLEIRVAYANVDRCCDAAYDPNAISDKGAGAERLCQANLFSSLPSFAKQQSSNDVLLFYCMVDLKGAVELSRPVIIGKSFGPCVERNFISKGCDEDNGDKLIVNPADTTAVELMPTITRKAG